MPTLTVEIRRKPGRPAYVSFLVCAGRTKKRIPTGLSLDKNEVTATGRIRNVLKARAVEKKRREFQDRLDVMLVENAGGTLDADTIVRRLTQSPAQLDFFAFADQWLKRATIKGSKNYECLLKALQRHLGGERRLPFSAITYTFLRSFEESLAGKPRAQTLYLGEMRHLYREAMREYNTDTEQILRNDPFLRYRVPRQRLSSGVRALTLPQLLAIWNCHPRPHSRAQLARDCFMLSFCMMGINSADLYLAEDLSGDYLRYRRAKTKDRRADGAYIEVRIHPVIQSLIKRYSAASKRHAFIFYQRYSDSANFNRAINIGLKDVGKQIGVPGLNFYQARHTFATLSRNLMRFSKSDVDEALNHVGSLSLADVYIKRDFSIINDNNFRLLDAVLLGKPIASPSLTIATALPGDAAVR